MNDMAVTKCDTIAKREFTNAVNSKFRSLCETHGVKYLDVASAIGLSPRAAAGLYAGNYEYSLGCDAVAAIADYFEISLDSLRK
jgi:transcriptional regulator with XRE-family HTH domain